MCIALICMIKNGRVIQALFGLIRKICHKTSIRERRPQRVKLNLNVYKLVLSNDKLQLIASKIRLSLHNVCVLCIFIMYI